MKKEIWRPVVGYEGLYMVSNYGRVKSLNYNKTGKEQLLTIKKYNGYCYVYFSTNGKLKGFRVHRLVWEAFNGPIPKGMQINHLNERKTDNRLENLSLVSAKANCNWGTRNRRISETQSLVVLQYDLNGNLIKTWVSATEAANNGYNRSCINACCLGNRKTHKGYIWKYKGEN